MFLVTHPDSARHSSRHQVCRAPGFWGDGWRAAQPGHLECGLQNEAGLSANLVYTTSQACMLVPPLFGKTSNRVIALGGLNERWWGTGTWEGPDQSWLLYVPERRAHIGQERVCCFCISPASRPGLNWREVPVDFIIIVWFASGAQWGF